MGACCEGARMNQSKKNCGNELKRVFDVRENRAPEKPRSLELKSSSHRCTN